MNIERMCRSTVSVGSPGGTSVILNTMTARFITTPKGAKGECCKNLRQGKGETNKTENLACAEGCSRPPDGRSLGNKYSDLTVSPPNLLPWSSLHMQKWDKRKPINTIIQVQPFQEHSFIDSGYERANKRRISSSAL